MTMVEVNEGLKRHRFWDFNIGHLFIFIGLSGAFLMWWANFGSLPQKNAESIAALTLIVKEINEKGPVWGRINMQQNQSDIHQLDIRITKLELNYSQLNDKLTAVQSKLDIIAALLEEKKQKPK